MSVSSHKMRLLFALVFLVLLQLAGLAVTPTLAEPPRAETRVAPLPGITLFEEDFTTTTYEDAGNTTAYGWGGGSIRNPRSTGVTFLDFWSSPYPVCSIDVQGRKAYAVLHNRTSAIETQYVFNISDPSNIIQLSNQTTASWLYTSEIAGDIMFGGKSSPPRIGLYNVSNPYQISFPVDQNTFTSGTVMDLAVQGHFLYVTIFGSVAGEGLNVIDIEDPTNIRVINGFGASFLGLDVQGQLAYIANGTGGFTVLNVSNPYSITELDSLDTPGNATDVLIDGMTAYVADGASGIRIINVSDPTNLDLLGGYNTPGYAHKLALQGYTLLVADGAGGVRILDVSNPSTPTEVTNIAVSYVYDVALFDGVLVIGADDGIYTYRVGTTMNLSPASSYSTYEAFDVDVQGDVAFVAAGADGLVILDVSDRALPTLITQYKHSSTVNYVSIEAQGSYCYILDASSDSGSRGLWAVDVSNPSSPVFRSRREFIEAYDLALDGDVAYVANGTGGLAVVNVSNSFNINVDLDWVYDASNYTAVCAQGRYVYAVASGANDGLFIYEATDLSAITLTSSLAIDSPLDVEVSGDFCVVANETGGILLLNVTDPWSTPILLDYYSSLEAHSAEMFGNYLLAAFGYSGIFLLDASTPTSMSVSTSYQPSNIDFRQVKIAGDYAYAACRDSLVIFRVFLSTANSYDRTSIAQSLDLDDSGYFIGNATLNYVGTEPYNTSLTWFLSADGGSHWKTATPGTLLSFVYKGTDLRWRVQIDNSLGDRTAVLTYVNLTYNTLPKAPILDPLTDPDKDGKFNVSWSPSTDDTGVVSYQLQMSDSIDFGVIKNSWVVTRTWQNVTVTVAGTRYFRVRARDDNGEYSLWSTEEVISIVIIPPYPPPPGIPGFPLEAVAVGLTLTIGFALVRRRSRKLKSDT